MNHIITRRARSLRLLLGRRSIQSLSHKYESKIDASALRVIKADSLKVNERVFCAVRFFLCTRIFFFSLSTVCIFFVVCVYMCPSMQDIPEVPEAFGAVFTDYMLEIDWTRTNGWEAPVIKPLANLSMHPGTSSLQYSIQVHDVHFLCSPYVLCFPSHF